MAPEVEHVKIHGKQEIDIVEGIRKWLTFGLNAEQEERFRQANFGADVTQARIFILLIVLPFVALVANDYGFFGLSHMFYGLLALRFAFAAYTILFLKKLRELPNYRSYDRAEFVWGIFLALTHITINVTRPENFIVHTIITVLVVFITMLVIPNRFSNQLILSLVYTLGQILVIAPSLWISPQISVTVLLSMSMANAIAIVSGWLLHHWRRREFLTHEEIRKARLEAEMQLIEREKIEKALLRKEYELNEAQRIAHVGSWYWDARTDANTVSDELLRIFGQAISPFKEQKGTIYPPESWERLNAVVQRAVQTGVGYELDLEALNREGHPIWITTRGEAVYDANGTILGLRGTIQDITERKREEHRIRRYNSVLEGINRIFGSVVRAETEEELGNACLSVALDVTGSQIGFVGEVGPDRLLHDIAISEIGWEQCTMKYKTGHSRLPGDFILHGLYGCVVDTGKSFFTNDPQSHPNSIGLPQGHPVLKSFLGVPLILEEKTVGMLAVANREGGYSSEQQEDLETIAPAVTQALRRKKAEEALAKIDVVRQKEIHHRIKNNLQVISSLLDLQAEKFNNRECVENSEVLEAFRESQDRVASMALIHEELYKGEEFETLDFSPYIKKLVENLFQTYRLGNLDVNITMDLEEDIFFNMDTAVPLGIIVNELVSNSLKHAFTGRDKGTIRIRFFKEEGERISNLEKSKTGGSKSTSFILSISDDGIGIPESLDIKNLDSLGLQLVVSLVNQLDGEAELKRNNGTRFIIRFKVVE